MCIRNPEETKYSYFAELGGGILVFRRSVPMPAVHFYSAYLLLGLCKHELFNCVDAFQVVVRDFFVTDTDVEGFFQKLDQAKNSHGVDDTVLGQNFIVGDLVDALGLRELLEHVLADAIFHFSGLNHLFLPVIGEFEISTARTCIAKPLLPQPAQKPASLDRSFQSRSWAARHKDRRVPESCTWERETRSIAGVQARRANLQCGEQRRRD